MLGHRLLCRRKAYMSCELHRRIRRYEDPLKLTMSLYFLSQLPRRALDPDHFSPPFQTLRRRHVWHLGLRISTIRLGCEGFDKEPYSVWRTA